MSKNVVITGTSRGIGLELCKQMASAGHRIFALSRKHEPVDSLNLENVTAISTDLSEIENIQTAVSQIKSEVDQIDILIHNAGMLVNKPFEELSQDDFMSCYQVNVFGVAALTQSLLPLVKSGSHVVGISSMGGIQGSSKFPGLAAYSSAKGAIITLFELLAEEYKERQISFNTLALGAVQTEMLAAAFPGYEAPTTPQQMAAYIMNFSLTGHNFYNGKTLQVSNSTP
jgi:NAD(P)-dependent dehydrogenase (short-subunit alcohol dehydrogenase family)